MFKRLIKRIIVRFGGDGYTRLVKSTNCVALTRFEHYKIRHCVSLKCEEQENGASDAERDGKNDVSVSKHIHKLPP